MPEIAYVNGSFMPIADAVVSIEDRGFQFADGVYEVLATYKGELYAPEAHYQRLERSLAALCIDLDIGQYGLRERVLEGIQHSGFTDVLVYIQITRGKAPRHHEFPVPKAEPTVVMTVKEVRRPPAEFYRMGVRVISQPDLRWKRCDIKSIALLPNILAKQTAAAAGAYEALLVNAEGQVTEGSSTSAFCVRQGVVWTAPEGSHILPSITRAVLLRLARAGAIAVEEASLGLDQYLAADEVFLAGTTTEAMPVVQIDGEQIGDGRPGPLTRRIRLAFLETL